MPFIDEILKYKSVSVVGLEKNTGKTECLNYIIERIKEYPLQVALTSIGIDGEQTDQVTQTRKPEIKVFENMIFATSEKHYREKKIIAEILALSSQRTALGRLVTARAKSTGKLLLSGPPSTFWMQNLVCELQLQHVDLLLVDGALSRLSLASPAVTDAMVLCTGATVSANVAQLIKKTSFAYKLICIKEVDSETKIKLNSIEQGVWAVDSNGELHDLHTQSVFSLNAKREDLFSYGTTFFVSGAVGDRFLNLLRIQPNIEEIVLIIRDFTKAFVSEESYLAFTKRGGRIKVLQKTKLLAVCVNPTAPNGFVLPSQELRTGLQQAIQIPVYDIKQLPKN